MKLKNLAVATVIFLISTTIVQAQWIAPGSRIVHMQMSRNGGSIVVLFDSAFGVNACPSSPRISINAQDARFQEMYAGLLRAQAAQTRVQVNGRGVTCTAGNQPAILSPSLRFLSE